MIGLADGTQLLGLTFEQLHMISGVWPGINDEPATARIEKVGQHE